MDQLPPERDRRQRRRVLTLRNIGLVTLAVIFVFIGVSLWNEFRPSSGDGSALLDSRRQVTEDYIVKESAPYVDTSEISEHDPREPLWVERPDKDEILGVDPYEHYRQSNEGEPLGTTDREPVLSHRGAEEPFLGQRTGEEKSRIKITGSGSDVKLEKPDEPDE